MQLFELLLHQFTSACHFKNNIIVLTLYLTSESVQHIVVCCQHDPVRALERVHHPECSRCRRYQLHKRRRLRRSKNFFRVEISGKNKILFINIHKQWCNRGKCIAFGTLPESKDGGWGEWSHWSVCSRTCGVGAASSYRTCNNPMPENGGSYCIGRRKRYQTCNTQVC